MSPAKNLGEEGSKENFRGGGGGSRLSTPNTTPGIMNGSRIRQTRS